MNSVVHLEPIGICRSQSDYRHLIAKGYQNRLRKIEAGLVGPGEEFQVPGHCAICNLDVEFLVDHKFTAKRVPNWRERLVCPACKLNNRLRLCLHFLRDFTSLDSNSRIYVTEEATRLFAVMKLQWPNVVGSEYLGDGTTRGETDRKGLRNEDLTALTFSDGAFDLITTFDVLEHIPDYKKAIAECARCLRPGGRLLITVPFNLASPTTIIRARRQADGTIEHLLPPLYHGDPLNSSGVLCYQIFGWDLLTLLKGLNLNATVYFFWSDRFGYLGGLQPLVFARRSMPFASKFRMEFLRFVQNYGKRHEREA
jgi:hypothetical protein